MRALVLALLVAFAILPARAAAPWTPAAAAALLDYGQRIDSHGLDPADYQLDRLRLALTLSDQAGLDTAATRSFALLARDLANGRVPLAQRRLSFFRGMGLTPEGTLDLVDRALGTNDVAGTLDRLAPWHPDYRMLRAALVGLPAGAGAERATVRANLERWRWLPRSLGERYLIVNIPEYSVRLIEGGQVAATHRVIVGKAATPTPQFSTSVTGVILNPVWRVPQSIIAESVGALVRTRPAEAARRGYSWTGSGASLQVTQKAGPTNALGQVKLEMLNPLSIYLHDTPSKALFDQQTRTYSHGCIRTEKPEELAARLLAGTQWTPARIAQTIAGGKTVTARLPQALPVYVVYFTARADAGGRLALFDDPYKLDAALGPGLAHVPVAGDAFAATTCTGLPG